MFVFKFNPWKGHQYGPRVLVTSQSQFCTLAEILKFCVLGFSLPLLLWIYGDPRVLVTWVLFGIVLGGDRLFGSLRTPSRWSFWS
jgi:hypothetical protein